MAMRKVFSSVMKKVGEAVPNQKLIQERLQHHLTQEELAERIGTNSISISRWERGIAFPSAYLRQKLREFYGKSDGELGLLKDQRARRAFTRESFTHMECALSTQSILYWTGGHSCSPP